MKLKRVAKIVLCLALLFVMGGECLLSPFLVKAEANTSKYSNVLDDLKKDNFILPEPLVNYKNDDYHRFYICEIERALIRE